MQRCALAMCFFVAGTLSSCQNQLDTYSSEKPNTIRVNLTKPPSTIDPRKNGDYQSSTVICMLFEGLTRADPNSSHTCALAKHVDVSPDQTTYVFHLRDAFWSDGSPITAFDVAQSWRDVLAPDFSAYSVPLYYSILNAEEIKKGLAPIEGAGIHVLDDKTVEIVLKRPVPYFLELTSSCFFFPASQSNYENPMDVVSSGPFRMKEYVPEQRYVLEKNPYYWDAENVSIEEVVISFVDSEVTAYQMFKKGDLDIMGMVFTVIPKDVVPQLYREGSLTTYPAAMTKLSQFNTKTFPFNSLNLRKAFALAINREDLVTHIREVDGVVATSIIPPILKDFKPTEPFFPDGDIESAKHHLNLALEELGCSLDDLQDISYLYAQSSENKQIVQVVQQQIMSALGIRIRPIGCEYKVFLDKIRNKNFTFCQSAWLAQYNDPVGILERFRSAEEPNNDTYWSSDAFTQLVDQSYYSPDPSVRNARIEEAERIFMEAMPQTPLFHHDLIFTLQPNVHGLHISPIGSIYLQYMTVDAPQTGR